jgi:hypothetical protein
MNRRTLRTIVLPMPANVFREIDPGCVVADGVRTSAPATSTWHDVALLRSVLTPVTGLAGGRRHTVGLKGKLATGSSTDEGRQASVEEFARRGAARSRATAGATAGPQIGRRGKLKLRLELLRIRIVTTGYTGCYNARRRHSSGPQHCANRSSLIRVKAPPSCSQIFAI